jgi:hypothetical protein
MLQFFQDFGNLINTTLILLLGGLLVRVLQGRIGLLEERLKVTEMFSAKKFKEELDALQSLVEADHERRISSIRKFEDAAAQYIALTEPMLREPLAKRSRLGEGAHISASEGDVCGLYRVVGRNPYAEDAIYSGELRISQSGSVLVAEWTLGVGSRKQKYEGVGVVVGAVAGFVFPFAGAISSRPESGVVLYSVSEPGVMKGLWTGSGSRRLGFEECRRVD